MNIKQDVVSKISVGIAIFATIFLATYSTTTVIIFPAVLLLAGVGMEYFFRLRGQKNSDDVESTVTKDSNILFYGIIATIGMLVISFLVSFIQLPSAILSDTADAAIYSVLMAIAETQFFQGFVLNYLVTHDVKIGRFRLNHNVGLAIFIASSGALIMHLARYGNNPTALMYVFAGFVVLNLVTYKTKSLGAATIGHSINNVLASLGLVTVMYPTAVAAILLIRW